jgi:hypothetical protein
MEQAEVLQTAMEYPLDSVLCRYRAERGLAPSQVSEHARELRRFLALCALNPAAAYGMAGPVDDLWHTFLLSTREYSDFCSALGGRFIHHIPAIDSNSSKDGYLRFLYDYAAIYGEDPPRHIWPRLPAQDDGEKCSGCKGCGV